MPAIAEKYEIDFEETSTITTAPRNTQRGATTRTSSPARWKQVESLVEHFGETAVAEPMPRQRRKPLVTFPEPTPVETPRPASKTAPRRAVRHQPFHLTLAAIIMWSTVSVLTLFLLGLNAATLTLSQSDVSKTADIKLSQEAIDNYNKSIAAVQVSPQTAQWALTHGWHVAGPRDINEVPATSSQTTEVGKAQ